VDQKIDPTQDTESILNFRRLSANDFQQMYPLFQKLLQDEIPEIIHRSKFFLEGDYSPSRVSFSLSHPQVVVIGCFAGETLKGFVWGNAGYAGLGFVSWLMVDRDSRNARLGSQLLKKYEEYIKGIGGHVIELYCFEGLRGFYEKNNYTQIGMRPKGYFGLKQYIYNKLI
jgi:GNAT superfamily N-acetyltransferase